MKRYWWFLLLLLFSGVLLIYKKSQNRSVDNYFSISDTAIIQSIWFQKQSDTIILVRSNGRWLFGSVEADIDAVSKLMNVLANLSVVSPAPISMIDTLMEQVHSAGIEVNVINGKESKHFYILSKSAVNGRNIACNVDSRNPFIVELPKFNGNIVDLFVVEKSYWTGSRLFDVLMDKVSRIEVVSTDVKNSFAVNIGSSGVSLENMQTRETVGNPDIFKINRFIAGLENLSIKKIDDIQQQLEQAKPFRIITAYTSSGKSSKIEFFQIKIKERTNELGIKINYDPDKFYIRYGENRLAIGTYVNFAPVLKDLNDLIVKN